MPNRSIVFLIVIVLTATGTGACGQAPKTGAAYSPLPGVGDLILPDKVTPLPFSPADLAKLLKLPGISGLALGAYTTPQPPAELLAFYRQHLPPRGWQAQPQRDSSGLIYFSRAGQTSAIMALPVPGQQAADALSRLIPSFGDTLKPATTLLVLAQAPDRLFTLSQGP